MADPTNIQTLIRERFAQLPKAVQNAITSPETEKQLRELATAHKLDDSQWERLENEVIMALLGATPVEGLEANIKTEIGVPDDVAGHLTDAITSTVFDPIRHDLDQRAPEPAHATSPTSAEAARPESAAAAATTLPASPAPIVQPATPPAPKPDIKIERPPAAQTYRLGEISTSRKAIHDDPYREPPL